MIPQIRAATIDDIGDLRHLLKQLFSIEEDFVFDAEKQEQGLKLLLNADNAHVAVANIDNQVVGMATGQLLISTAEGAQTLLIEDVVIAPHYQRRGLGRLLLQATADWALSFGAQRMQLLADKNNTKALAFYTNDQWQTTQLICLRKYNPTSSVTA